MTVRSENVISEARNLLRSGKPAEAGKILAVALVDELENKDILFAISCCNFWNSIIANSERIDDLFEKAESLVNEWKSFLSNYPDAENPANENTVYAVKAGVFSLALNCYSQIIEEKDSGLKAEIKRKMGLCFKKQGEYETARNCLTEANTLKPGSAPILAELADCYALCGEERQAKVLFREAFYISAEKIEPAFLDSELINCLVRDVKGKGFSGQELLEWIPVYGQLFGVFTVKRRLRPQEVGRLKQDIYAKENEIKAPGSKTDILVPQLINLYFWLIDYYVVVKEETRRINDILTRIRVLDPNIYELYVK